MYLGFLSLADPAVWRTGDRRPLRIFFSIFPQQKRKKKGVVLPQIGFENRFLTMIAAHSDKPPSLH
jgi:hypothetical protein